MSRACVLNIGHNVQQSNVLTMYPQLDPACFKAGRSECVKGGLGGAAVLPVESFQSIPQVCSKLF